MAWVDAAPAGARGPAGAARTTRRRVARRETSAIRAPDRDAEHQVDEAGGDLLRDRGGGAEREHHGDHGRQPDDPAEEDPRVRGGEQQQVHERGRDQGAAGGREHVPRGGGVAPGAFPARGQDRDVEQPAGTPGCRPARSAPRPPRSRRRRTTAAWRRPGARNPVQAQGSPSVLSSGRLNLNNASSTTDVTANGGPKLPGGNVRDHGFNAATKNALDYLNAEWRDKPAGIVSYGAVSGGTRATQMLKQVFSGVRLVPVTDSVNIPFVREKLDEDGRLKPNEIMEQAADAMLDELARYAEALRPLRPAGPT